MTYPTVSMSQLPASELDAVNYMLETIGESKITALPSTNADAVVAKDTLYQTILEVLSTGWYFNTYENYTITADGSGYLNIPTTALNVWIDPTTYSSNDVVQKGTKLWDRKNQTYTFSAGTTVTVAITELMDYADLPPDARMYITVRASRLFMDRVKGDPLRPSPPSELETRALALLKQNDTDRSRYTLFDNMSVRRVVDRTSQSTSNFYSQ